MTDPAEGLGALIDVPPAPPEPLEDLQRRVERRRRRRFQARAAVAGLAVMGAAVAVVDRPSGAPVQVVTGPAHESEATTTTRVRLEFVAGQPIRYRIDVTVPPGWQTLFSAGDHLVVATRPLSDADRSLALLARDDTAFASLPADAVVVVVGNDPVEAKGVMGPDGSVIGPGPAYDLGPAKVLAGGVRVRRGDVPQSGVKIAAYAGPSAPAARVAEAETIARTLRLVATGDPSVRPPPPPDGSRPGLPLGTLPVPEAGLPEVARTAASGSTLVLVAGQDCAYLRWTDAQTSRPGYQPLAGACGNRPAGTAVETFGIPVRVMRGPGSTDAVAVIFRAGPGVTQLTARVADGRTVAAQVGTDGWGIVASDGRIVAVGETPVG